MSRRGDTSVFERLNEAKIFEIELMLSKSGFTDAEKKMLQKKLSTLKKNKFKKGGLVKNGHNDMRKSGMFY
jgi:hypothetical protein